MTVIEALLEVLGEEGTLMMPAHSADNTEPSRWCIHLFHENGGRQYASTCLHFILTKPLSVEWGL